MVADWRKIERDARDILGEGACWNPHDDAFYWVDILAPALNRLSLETGEVERWPMPEPLGWVVRDDRGGFIGGFQSGFGRISLNPVSITMTDNPEPHFPNSRMNDGKADQYGAIWCGTMDMAEEHERGALYRLAPDGSWQVMDSGYMVPNGPAFSPCGQWLYHTDTAKRIIYRFERDGEAGLIGKHNFITFSAEDGYPDGMTVDAEGHLWVAHWDGGRVSRFTPDGKCERTVSLPAKRITNMAFCGQNLDRLFVTSASIGLPESEFDGALFEVEAGVSGLPTNGYTGCMEVPSTQRER